MRFLKGIFALFEGMKMVAIHLFRPAVTVKYPEKRDKFSSRLRGCLAINVDKNGKIDCVGCRSCIRVCPWGRSRQETHPGPVQGGYRKVARQEHQPCPQHIRPHPGRTEQKGQGVHTVHHRQEREDEGVRRFVHVACERSHR